VKKEEKQTWIREEKHWGPKKKEKERNKERHGDGESAVLTSGAAAYFNLRLSGT
jgi:hypothetical protein